MKIELADGRVLKFPDYIPNPEAEKMVEGMIGRMVNAETAAAAERARADALQARLDEPAEVKEDDVPDPRIDELKTQVAALSKKIDELAKRPVQVVAKKGEKPAPIVLPKPPTYDMVVVSKDSEGRPEHILLRPSELN